MLGGWIAKAQARLHGTMLAAASEGSSSGSSRSDSGGRSVRLTGRRALVYKLYGVPGRDGLRQGRQRSELLLLPRQLCQEGYKTGGTSRQWKHTIIRLALAAMSDTEP